MGMSGDFEEAVSKLETACVASSLLKLSDDLKGLEENGTTTFQHMCWVLTCNG